MHAKVLLSPSTFSRHAYHHAMLLAEKAEDAEMAAMIAWAHMRAARERLRQRGRCVGGQAGDYRVTLARSA